MSAGASGSTRQRSSATLGDIVCVGELDKATPKLKEAICLHAGRLDADLTVEVHDERSICLGSDDSGHSRRLRRSGLGG